LTTSRIAHAVRDNGSMRIFLLAVAGLLASSQVARAELELKNDSFVTNQTAGFQQGFVKGEIGASRFVAPDAGRTLLKVQLLFGGAATKQTVTLRVYDDTQGTDAPGAELFAGDFEMTGANNAMQELLIGNVTVPQQFRIGIQFQHDGLPSIARDTDNTIAADKNYMFAIPGGWIKSSSALLKGDWIIRAFVSDGAGPSPDGAGTDAGVTGAACNGNPDCPAGQFCDLGVHHCTFECRVNADCGEGTCNSLGQCVGGKSGGGCCEIDGGDAAGAAALTMGVLVISLRRRKRA
jgi:hypothetical protein